MVPGDTMGFIKVIMAHEEVLDKQQLLDKVL